MNNKDVYLEKKTSLGSLYYELSTPVAKSPNDNRDYLVIKLCNELEVLLVSDKEADKSAAALDVFVGSQSDPVDLPGLAHFCEHLLFMGTEKYPKENDYSEYLAKHGGSSNAFTSFDHTNYYFEIATEYLEGALDRFSQFFISSLFSPTCTEREINAVNSENDKNLQDDGWRINQLLKSQFKKEHPYSNFSTGNLDTLWVGPKSRGIDIRDSLIDFYKKNYSSSIMKLVVCGKESLQQLVDWVVPKFSDIINLDIQPPNVSESPFHNDMFKKVLNVVPVRDTRTLELYFEIPNQYENYQSKPSAYISHLLGHEGPGSLLSLFKANNWATSLSASASTEYAKFSYFEISVELTPFGIEHREEIIYTIFQYIRLLKEQGIKEEYFNELQELGAIDFRFQEKYSVSSYASYLADIMHNPQPSHQVLTAQPLLYKYDPQAITQVLSYLIPDKLLVLYINKAIKDSGENKLQTEKWYGTEHFIEPLSTSLLQKLYSVELNSKLVLPKPNMFIPKKFGLVDTSLALQETPILLSKDESGSLFYQRGAFEVPRAYLHIHLKNQYVYATPRLFCALELLRSIIMENLNEYSYDASMAGLYFGLEATYNGLVIFIGGYSDKIELLLMEILEHMVNLEVSDNVFNTWKDEIVRHYENTKVLSPIYFSDFYNSFALLEKYWADDEKLRETSTLTKPEIEVFAKTFMSRIYVEALVVGNITPTDSVKLLNHVHATLNFTTLSPTELVGRRSILLPATCELVFRAQHPNPDDVNSAIDFYVNLLDTDTYLNQAYSNFIQYLLEEPAFNQLRTVEQLGYSLQVSIRSQVSSLGISIMVQSNRDPVYLEERIENFLTLFLEQVRNLSPEEFEKRKRSLITLMLKKDDNLYELVSKQWSLMSTGEYDFNLCKEVAKALEKVTQPKIVELIQDYLIKGGVKRRKLSVHLSSQKLEPEQGNYTVEDCGEKITDLLSWKIRQNFTRAPVPIAPLEVIQLSNLTESVSRPVPVIAYKL